MSATARKQGKSAQGRADTLAFIDRQLDHLADGQTITIRNMGGRVLIMRDYVDPPAPPIVQGA